MAEFQEVMRQMFRLHKACGVECLMDDGNQCPLFAIERAPCGWLHSETEYQAKQMEEAVMSWAAEHPEPIYPTWGEWFAEQGELSANWKDLRVVSCSGKFSAGIIGLFYNEIPADIAQKLGIEQR